MVNRCGFFTEDGLLCRKVVQIPWDKGFDKAAKQEYIRRVQVELGSEMQPCIDVTTASPIHEAKMLSPFYIKTDFQEMILEDYWAYLKKQHPEITTIEGSFDYLYLNHLTQKQKEYVLGIKCFVDVFHEPYKAFNTQAKSLAIYQLLVSEGKEDYLSNFSQFTQWYSLKCNKRYVKDV